MLHIDHALHIPETAKFTGTRVTVMLELTGAADSLPAYASNLDIMMSAAVATAEHIVRRSVSSEPVALRATAPVYADDYRRNRITGSFVLIDEASNQTAAAGMLRTST